MVISPPSCVAPAAVLRHQLGADAQQHGAACGLLGGVAGAPQRLRQGGEEDAWARNRPNRPAMTVILK